MVVGGWFGSRCFGWWHSVGRIPPPFLTHLLGWIKISKCSSLTKPNLTVINPTWESSLCSYSCHLITFFITSLVLLSTKFLGGLSRRIPQPTTQLLERHWRRNKLQIGFFQPVPIRGCWSRDLIQTQLSPGLFLPFCLGNRWTPALFATESPGASSSRKGESYFTLLTSLGEDKAENIFVTVSK